MDHPLFLFSEKPPSRLRYSVLALSVGWIELRAALDVLGDDAEEVVNGF